MRFLQSNSSNTLIFFENIFGHKKNIFTKYFHKIFSQNIFTKYFHKILVWASTKYRDTYRIVTQVSRYVSHRDFRYRATPRGMLSGWDAYLTPVDSRAGVDARRGRVAVMATVETEVITVTAKHRVSHEAFVAEAALIASLQHREKVGMGCVLGYFNTGVARDVCRLGEFSRKIELMSILRKSCNRGCLLGDFWKNWTG